MTCLRLQELATHHGGPTTFTLNEGESLCLNGPSGSGKTLLLRAIADLDPHTGEVYFNDIACSQYEAMQWRRTIALLPAESQWWHDTVVQHFEATCLQANEIQQLNQLGFEEDVLQWPVSRLSSGEKQRLSLLRLLNNRPQVLLLDEPTTNLDAENIQRVEALLFHYQKHNKAIMVWVTHDEQQQQRVAGKHYTLVDHVLTETGVSS